MSTENTPVADPEMARALAVEARLKREWEARHAPKHATDMSDAEFKAAVSALDGRTKPVVNEMTDEEFEDGLTEIMADLAQQDYDARHNPGAPKQHRVWTEEELQATAAAVERDRLRKAEGPLPADLADMNALQLGPRDYYRGLKALGCAIPSWSVIESEHHAWLRDQGRG